MASVNFVLLLVAALVACAYAQFPSPFSSGSAFGSLGRPQGNPYFSGHGSFQEPQILTCIGRNEALDQFKVTIRPEPTSFSNFGYGNQSPALRKITWRVSALYIPSTSIGAISPPGTTSLVGQFFVAVTRYGRTDGSCAGQGGVLQEADLIQSYDDDVDGPFSEFDSPYFDGYGGFGAMGGFGGGPGFGGIGGRGFNPYMNFNGRHGHRGQGFFGGRGGAGGYGSAPPGVIEDSILVSGGSNVFTGVVRGVSEADLKGRGVAICLDHFCTRPTTTCCTIAKDSAPATEQIGVPNTGPYSGTSIASGVNPNLLAGGGFNAGLATAQATTVVSADNVGGLF